MPLINYVDRCIEGLRKSQPRLPSELSLVKMQHFLSDLTGAFQGLNKNSVFHVLKNGTPEEKKEFLKHYFHEFYLREKADQSLPMTPPIVKVKENLLFNKLNTLLVEDVKKTGGLIFDVVSLKDILLGIDQLSEQQIDDFMSYFFECFGKSELLSLLKEQEAFLGQFDETLKAFYPNIYYNYFDQNPLDLSDDAQSDSETEICSMVLENIIEDVIKNYERQPDLNMLTQPEPELEPQTEEYLCNVDEVMGKASMIHEEASNIKTELEILRGSKQELEKFLDLIKLIFNAGQEQFSDLFVHFLVNFSESGSVGSPVNRGLSVIPNSIEDLNSMECREKLQGLIVQCMEEPKMDDDSQFIHDVLLKFGCASGVLETLKVLCSSDSAMLDILRKHQDTLSLRIEDVQEGLARQNSYNALIEHRYFELLLLLTDLLKQKKQSTNETVEENASQIEQKAEGGRKPFEGGNGSTGFTPEIRQRKKHLQRISSDVLAKSSALQAILGS